VAVTTLAADVERPDESLDDNTAHRYLDALDRLMVTENLPAWAPHLRSKVSFRRSVKRHFVDPSLAVAALHAIPDRLIADLNLTGFLFESLVVRDLRVYAQAAGASDSRARSTHRNRGSRVCLP
jgi:predicted AAA+ superfamily ATPase